MSKLKYVRAFRLGILLCVAVSLLGCGRKQTGPLSQGNENSGATPGAEPVEASLEQQTEQKLDPLTKDDVALYLKVMRAAADRVKACTPDDQAKLEGARKILAGGASRIVPTLDDVKTLERANLVALYMDQIVAEEMKIDGRKYRGIAEAVESVVSNPTLTAVSDDGAMPVADHAPAPLEKRLIEVKATNQGILAPYQREIQKLLAVVRNPANLPK